MRSASAFAFTAVTALALQGVAATGWRSHKPYQVPSNYGNQCTEDEGKGWDFNDLPDGGFDSYKDYNFSGWKCGNKFGKRSLEGRSFNSRCISAEVKEEEYTNEIKCDKKDFSIGEIDVSLDDEDQDVEFHYEMKDGSSCKKVQRCGAGGTTVKNDQCGGATKVKVKIPKKKNGGGKKKCNVNFHSVKFECGTSTTSVPVPTSTIPPNNDCELPSYCGGQVGGYGCELPSHCEQPTPTPELPSSVPAEPSSAPVEEPSSVPAEPSSAPVEEPSSSVPVEGPSSVPAEPSSAPVSVPSDVPSGSEPVPSGPEPSSAPVEEPSSSVPVEGPSSVPAEPSSAPVEEPSSSAPVEGPSSVPAEPSSAPVYVPSSVPSGEEPSSAPVDAPSSVPSGPAPSSAPVEPSASVPGEAPSSAPVSVPSSVPSGEEPSSAPVYAPSSVPSGEVPSSAPVYAPSSVPSGPGASSVPVTGEVPSASVPVYPGESSVMPSGPPASATPDVPAPPTECPDSLPKCLNTWLFITECKDNANPDCYCPSAEFVEKVEECLYAYSVDDDEVSKTVEYFLGLCQKYIPKNPAIVDCIPPVVEFPEVTPIPNVPVETVVRTITTVVPCEPTTLTEGPSSGEVVTTTTSSITQTITIPQVTLVVTTTDAELVYPTVPAGATQPPAETPAPTGSAGIPEVPAGPTTLVTSGVPVPTQPALGNGTTPLQPTQGDFNGDAAAVVPAGIVTVLGAFAVLLFQL